MEYVLVAAGCSNGRQDGTSVVKGRPHILVPGAAGVLSAVIVLILVLTSFSGILVLGEAVVVDDTPYSDSATRESSKSLIRPAMCSWNWDEYADDEGKVRVILGTDSLEALTIVVDRAVKTFDSSFVWSSQVDGEPLIAVKGHATRAMEMLSVEIGADTLTAILAREPSLWAYPDLTVNSTEVPANILQTGADQVWSTEDSSGDPVTGIGVSVAIIDTGIDYTHPDLGGGFGPGYKVVAGYDFVNDDDDPMDDNGHGTHVAGIVAANGGIQGVAPDATLYAYKALDGAGSGYMSDVILAIDTAIDPDDDGFPTDHVDVISLSLGGKGDSDDPLCQAVQRAVEAGVVVVVAAGNSGPSMGTVSSPGLSSYSLTVGAVDSDHELAEFSSRGPTADLLMKPDISAPGVAILSTVPRSGASSSSPTGYLQMSGTSMATPHVSGAAALLVQSHPDWTVARIKSALVTCAKEINESYWEAGSGELWIPSANLVKLFVDTPMVSYGRASSPSQSVAVTNGDGTTTFGMTSRDWFALSADGGLQTKVWKNYSRVSVSSLGLAAQETKDFSLTVNANELAMEGFYDGSIWMNSTLTNLRIPFGYLILSTMNVHVIDLAGREVFDSYGGVWVYSIPDAMTAVGKRGGNGVLAPPATFLLPSGTYSVHSAGHQLLYTYSDPYFLSKEVELGRMATLDVYLNMSDAREVTIVTENEDGNPIYVKDFRLYGRYEGDRNLSFDLIGSDYSVYGSDLFTLPKSMALRLSDTAAGVGIQMSGFSYSSAMWDFMNLNQDNWFEFKTGSSTAFLIEATADLQYLLAWEFPVVDDSTPTTLTHSLDSSGVYVTKHDIPGIVLDPWCNWDTHRAMGGDAAFYTRRDTQTTLNPFFAGMTRTTVVRGVFSELYFPGNPFVGYVERSFFTADYSRMLHVATASEIYVPDRYFLEPLAPTVTDESIGSGPFYPSVRTENTDDALVIIHPLLRDQNGWRVGGADTPMLSLYRGNSLAGIYQLSEHLARPDAKRIIDLTVTGTYTAKIAYSPFTQIYDDVLIELGFTVPRADSDPPVMSGMQLIQRFVPGQAVPIAIVVQDSSSISMVEMHWRAGAGASWIPLTVTNQGGGSYTASIQTGASDSQIDVMFKATDIDNNFIKYTAYNASREQVPVIFELSVANGATDVEFRQSGVSIPLIGRLTDSLGNPLHSTAGVPIELRVDGEKIGMILDEYVSGTTHVHNGTIMFNWIVKPTEIFSGPDQDATVTATFDLGLYEPVTRTITLHSIPDTSVPPTITLVSPANNSMIPAGTAVDLEITDDGIFSAEYSVNGGSYVALASPWDISTASWQDGINSLVVEATDDDMLTASENFVFDVDALAPSLAITDPPANGIAVPRNYTIVVSVSDAHLSGVTYSVDGGVSIPLLEPYTISTEGWEIGWHTVEVVATDAVGHVSETSVFFEIRDTTIVLWLDSPSDESVIRSGTMLLLSVIGDGAVSCTWDGGAGQIALAAPYDIPTDGWTEGRHTVTVHAWNDLGDSDTLTFNVTIDDTLPTISLTLPTTEFALVRNTSVVLIAVADVHLQSASYTRWGETIQQTSGPLIVPLTSPPADGAFTISVSATDSAGNTATDEFTFIMDTSAPVITVRGIADVVRPTIVLNITVEDLYLGGVLLTLDGTQWSIPAEYSLPMEIGAGLHNLEITASDLAGNTGSFKRTFHVDGVAPTVSMSSGTDFAANNSFEVVASVSDDVAIAGATLYYSLPGGGFLQMPMSYNGVAYVTTLPSEALWDGMEIYVVAVDAAGNVGTGPTQVLHGIDSGDDVQDDESAFGWLFTGLNEFLLLGAIVAAAALIVIFMIYRKREDEEQWEVDLTKPSRPELKTEKTEPSKPSALGPLPARPSYVMAALQPEAPPAQRPKPEPEHPKIARTAPQEVSTMRKVSLIEVIPEPVMTTEDSNQRFYNEFLEDLEKVERELNENALRGSVYAADEEFEKLFDLDDKLETGQPKQVSGLKWKKLME